MYTDEFNSHSSICRKCILAGKRTKEWLVWRIYLDQRNSSKQRWHSYPNYSKAELIEWVFLQPNFEELYSKWGESWFDTLDRPSIDRIDESLWYCMSNIRLTTWRDNKFRYTDYRRNNAILKLWKKCVWVHIETKNIVTFNSLLEAERNTKIDARLIWKVCRWIWKTAWWYKWNFI